MGSMIEKAPDKKDCGKDGQSPFAAVVPGATEGWIERHERRDRHEKKTERDEDPLAVSAFFRSRREELDEPERDQDGSRCETGQDVGGKFARREREECEWNEGPAE